MEEQNKIKKEVTKAPTVETFTDDMVQVIEDSQGGLIKKIIEEQEKHEIEKKNFSPESKRNRTFILAGLVLILLAVALLAVLFFNRQNQVVPAANPSIPMSSIIYADKTTTEALDGLSNEQISANIFQEVSNADIKSGGVEEIYGTENGKVIGFRRLLALLKSNFTPGPASVLSDNFLMGAVNRETKDFFLLLRVGSFVDIFPVMRNWEAKMFSDLHGLFGLDLNAATNDLTTKNFEDGIVENKNARILYNDNGDIALMYVFADEHSIIVARSLGTVHEMMLRLASSQIKK